MLFLKVKGAKKYTDLQSRFRTANTRFYLEDTIISGKTGPCSGSTKHKRSIDSVGNNEATSAIFSFISTLYLKQKTNILPCFSSLKFENSLFSNKLLRCIFRSESKVYTFENGQSILFKTSLLKSHLSLCKLLLDFSANGINYVSLSLWSLSKDLFTIQKTTCS